MVYLRYYPSIYLEELKKVSIQLVSRLRLESGTYQIQWRNAKQLATLRVKEFAKQLCLLFYLMMMSVAQTIHYQMTEHWIGKGVEGSICGLAKGTVLAFARRDWKITGLLPFKLKFELETAQIQSRSANHSENAVLNNRKICLNIGGYHFQHLF